MDKESKLIIYILLGGIAVLTAMGVFFVMGTEPERTTITLEIPRHALTIR